LIRAHSESGKSRKGRPCNELGLSAHRLSAGWCRTFVLPAPRVPDGLTISLAPSGNSRTTRAPLISCRVNGIVERFHKTVLDEFHCIAFRKKIYGSIADLQGDLDSWIQSYNEERPHQGRWCFGKTPIQTFLNAIPLAKEKMIAA
jgi:Integrase core domain